MSKKKQLQKPFEQHQNPKVFISYSWSSSDYEKWVENFARRLMSDGVEVILDKWNLKEGQDKYVFMEKMVTSPHITKVLILSDEVYVQKANFRRGGVGVESQIISDSIYSKVNQEKFIPIVTQLDSDGEPYLPLFLKNRIYINFASSESFNIEYEKLLRNIFNIPFSKKPKLGRPPTFLFNSFNESDIVRDNLSNFEHSNSVDSNQSSGKKSISSFDSLLDKMGTSIHKSLFGRSKKRK